MCAARVTVFEVTCFPFLLFRPPSLADETTTGSCSDARGSEDPFTVAEKVPFSPLFASMFAKTLYPLLTLFSPCALLCATSLRSSEFVVDCFPLC